jgi:parallel beta-helix repeat protein
VFLSRFKKPVCLNISKGIYVLDDIVVCYTPHRGWMCVGGEIKEEGVYGKMNRNHGMVLIGIALLVFCAFVGTVSATDVYVPDNYDKIQWAVDNASTGDTIIVRDGTYNENVDVSKSLTIRSENGAAHSIINAGGGSAFNVFEPLSSPGGIEYVSINGFTVTGGSQGIYLYGACNNNTITNNIVSNNDIGILIDYADTSGHNSITNNIVSNNSGIGIALWAGAYDNTVANNTVSDEISVRQSYFNIITNNTISKGGRIFLDSMSQDNHIYNNYFDNYENAYDNGNNAWNIDKTAGTNIIGGPYLGGNYWGDYTGSDTDGDELGNTPYEIQGGENKDYLPLVEYVPDTTPPDTVITAGPSGTIDYNDVTFEWSGSDDRTETSDLEYQYKLDGFWSDWTSGTSVTYTDLSNGDYTFMVRAKDGTGIEDLTPAESSFTVSMNRPPDEPSDPSPAHHATDQSIDVDLSWTGGDPDAGDTVSYDVYFGTESNPSKASDDQSGTTYNPGSLSNGTKYYWKIEATDNHGASTSGPIWDFTAGAAPNNPPDTVITAGPSGTITYNDVQFDWAGTDDITETSKLVYQYTLDGSWSEWTSGTSKTYTDLSNGEYTFMVRARDEAENEDPTQATRSFTVSVTIRRSGGGGGGGGTSLDSDGDGYFDTVELLMGTDPKDPNDYPNNEAATPTPTPVQRTTTTMSTITTPTPTVTPTVPPPGGTPAPSPATPTPEEPGFAAISAVAGLLTIAYVMLRRRG